MDALDRMYQVLVRTIRAKHPAYLTAPFTVGEIHQNILPYRHFRRDLGIETNQEYELVLMELLSGARSYLDVDEKLRDQLGKELSAGTPEPARVREFADAHVTLNRAAAAKVTDAPAPSPRVSMPVSIPRGAAASPSTRCRYCGGSLPTGRDLNYCPHCGQNLRVLNCPACGAEVEADWKFCVACGKTAS